jgi:hypothetical protein
LPADDGHAIRIHTGLENRLRLQRPRIEPGQACRATIGDEMRRVAGSKAP